MENRARIDEVRARLVHAAEGAMSERDHKEAMHDAVNAKLGVVSSRFKIEAVSDAPCKLCDVDFGGKEPDLLASTTDFQAWICPQCGKPVYVSRGHAPWCYHVLGRCVLDAVERFGDRLTIKFGGCVDAPEHAHFHVEVQE